MSKSINAKTKSIQDQSKKQSSKRELKCKNKPRGQSGTHRLKQLNAQENINDEVVETGGWLRRIFRK